MSRIANIIACMEPRMQYKVIKMRETHSCLMELNGDMAKRIQRKALFLNYIQGEGRRLDKASNSFSAFNEH